MNMNMNIWIIKIKIPFYNARSMHRIREHQENPNNTYEEYQERTNGIDK